MRAVLAAVAAAFIWSAAAAEPPPLQAYARDPAFKGARLSPDGKQVAFIVEEERGWRVRVTPLDGGRGASFHPGERRPRSLYWVGPRYLLAVASYRIAGGGPFRAQEVSQALSLDVVDRKAVLLMNGVKRAANVLNASPQVTVHAGQPRVHVEGFDIEPGFAISLYRADPETGHAILVDKGTLESLAWAIGPDGEPVAKTERVRATSRWVLKVRRGRDWKEIGTGDGQPPVRLWGLGRDGKSILVLGDLKGNPGVFEVSPDTGTWSPSLVPAGEELARVFLDPAGRLLGLMLEGDPPQLLAYDPTLERAWAGVRETFTGQAPVIVDHSDDFRRLLVAVAPPGKAPAYYTFDPETRRAEPLGELYPDLGQLGPTRALTVRASDGRSIPALLTTPPGRDARNLPVVVRASGGGGAWTADFDWWTQALVSRGYAVLAVNHRGLSGLGQDHEDAGDGEFGRRMLTDVSDAVRQLGAEGTIDPARACVFGRGLGGYGALAGVTVQQGVYRCAVAVNALVDLPRELRAIWEAPTAAREAREEGWRRALGVRSFGDPRLAEILPAGHVGRGAAPVLLIHADPDDVYDADHSRDMHARLQKAGRRSELVILASEDHRLSSEAGRFRMLQETLRFLQAENPP